MNPSNQSEWGKIPSQAPQPAILQFSGIYCLNLVVNVANVSDR
ncbi:hypothetical protein [Anabaena sp. CCY 9402-a]